MILFIKKKEKIKTYRYLGDLIATKISIGNKTFSSEDGISFKSDIDYYIKIDILKNLCAVSSMIQVEEYKNVKTGEIKEENALLKIKDFKCKIKFKQF